MRSMWRSSPRSLASAHLRRFGAMAAAVFEITPGVQKYAWGKQGASSKVAQLGLSASHVEASTPYAELWMGTHPALPSTIHDSGIPLLEHLRKHPELLGSARETYQGDLPFLFKILSIRTALSIQAHPDKTFAKELHAKQPNVYKDPNHKPEMALALTDFVALCGFRPFGIIAEYLQTVPQLARLVPASELDAFIADQDAETFKDVFASIMKADPSLVKEQLNDLLLAIPASLEPTLSDLIKEIESQYPGDIGVFCLFLLNIVRLSPGEAIFLGAGEPHAYISGDIVECMATSDNVLRAGLTPKPRDVTALLHSLTYKSGLPDIHRVFPKPLSTTGTSLIYDPPVPEFSVLSTQLAAGASEKQRAFSGPSLAIVTSGSGTVLFDGGELPLREGSVFFVASGTEVTVQAGSTLVVNRAFNE
ncbi:mannose-6-phosphate isomerase [Auriculariales sp. MPI-PUGE-AT-0066]|nr:mannose-6-phosphate isomerase [Auriculariales sp. MPI-PUGE-AT-0066]